jgi:hypothetical protein
MERRKFIAGTGLLTGVSFLLGRAGITLGREDTRKISFSHPPLPWPYQKLDVELVRKRGYEGFYRTSNHCGAGSAYALLGILQETVGSPFSMIPVDMFRYGLAGSAQWGTLCGAINGLCPTIGLVVDRDTALKIVSELIGWYTTTPFPSLQHDLYAKFKGQPQVIPSIPLCHVSVSTWCKAANVRVNSPERDDRCAKVTGDVSAKAAELLNDNLQGRFTPVFKPSEAVAECMGCHFGSESPLDDVMAKMDCTSCHEPHPL